MVLTSLTWGLHPHPVPGPPSCPSSAVPGAVSLYRICAVGTLASVWLVTDPVDPGLNLGIDFWAWSWTFLITVDLFGDHQIKSSPWSVDWLPGFISDLLRHREPAWWSGALIEPDRILLACPAHLAGAGGSDPWPLSCWEVPNSWLPIP